MTEEQIASKKRLAGEKEVMRTAFDAGFPMIVIMENGFTPLSDICE